MPKKPKKKPARKSKPPKKYQIKTPLAILREDVDDQGYWLATALASIDRLIEEVTQLQEAITKPIEVHSSEPKDVN